MLHTGDMAIYNGGEQSAALLTVGNYYEVLDLRITAKQGRAIFAIKIADDGCDEVWVAHDNFVL